jgi:shikimate dehydrogenase
VRTEPQVLGVIGWPIAQSKSPAMQNAALHALGLDWSYVKLAVPPHQLAAALDGARALGFRGLNVTIPHKEAALHFCQPDALAREVGAVNTLSFEGERVLGFNTDVHGFRMLLAESGVAPGGRALILGAGGAARAVAMALRSTGHADIRVMSRHQTTLLVKGDALPAFPWDEQILRRELWQTDLLVDATPRGLDPQAASLDLSPLPAKAAVLDLVVKRETRLVADARRRGLRAATGVAMLLHQGAAALERWTGRPAPVEIMRAALEASLALD